MSDYSVSFRNVKRGYDPAQVDQHMHELAQAAASAWQEATERTRQINDLTTTNGKLTKELRSLAERTRALEAAQREAEAPTYTGLGERIGVVLTLVDNEVNELRTRAQAGAANSLALAEENALATRQNADKYSRETRTAAEDRAARVLEDARQQADSLLEQAQQQINGLRREARQEAQNLRDDIERQEMTRQDADRQAMARREETEALYEQARANAAAAAIDFETTLAARREASASEFAAQLAAAEQQLAAVRQRADRARNDSEQAQQEAAAKISQQLEQASTRAQNLVAEAKAKAERIREDSEHDLAAVTQRRDSVNEQLSKLHQELAALSAVDAMNPVRPEGPGLSQNLKQNLKQNGDAGEAGQRIVAGE
jgi:DivIVA domain-containing protein